MGEKENKPFQLSFNGLLKVEFRGSRVTSDGGLILVRELDERLGLGKCVYCCSMHARTLGDWTWGFVLGSE